MTPDGDPGRKPRTWAELRRRVLEENYLDLGELEYRKKRAHQMKFAIWFVPVILIGFAPQWIFDDVSWLHTGAVLLTCFGAVNAYYLGVRWERRWDDLIGAKSKQR